MEFEFRTLAVKGDLKLAVDVTVELDDVELGILALKTLQVYELMLDFLVDAQVLRHVLRH